MARKTLMRKRMAARVGSALLFSLLSAATTSVHSSEAASDSTYKPFPATDDSWYWEIDPPETGLPGLPPVTAAYPAPGSAKIWDTDLFDDSNTSSGGRLRVPTGPSPVITAIHAANHYAVCYVEAGAFQTGFPDDADFAKSDYGDRARRYQVRGYSNEWWFDIGGFKNYAAGQPTTLTGAAVNIATALNERFRWCALEGQNAVEPDDIDGYTNRSATGAKGGGWNLTRADSAGFERWLAYQAHEDGLAVLQKNDPANAKVDEPLFDGVLTEECNYYKDPCAGNGGDWDVYLKAGKPVLDAEYTQDAESTSEFCRADDRWGIRGVLFSADLNGSATYRVCWKSRHQL